MTKTQVYFDKEDLDALHKVAKRMKRPVAQLVREAVRQVWLQSNTDRPLALWDGKSRHTSVEHDSIYNRPIRSRRDHALAMREVAQLWGARAGTPKAKKLEVLVTLVDAYEAKHQPIALSTGNRPRRAAGPGSRSVRQTLTPAEEAGLEEAALSLNRGEGLTPDQLRHELEGSTRR